VELLRTADLAARRFNPDARIRLVPDGHGVRFELADGQVAGDAVVEHEAGFTLRPKKVLGPHSQLGKYGHKKNDDPPAPEPVGEASPQVRGATQAIDIRHDCCPCCGEPTHGLKRR
jgi:hypothetical protein